MASSWGVVILCSEPVGQGRRSDKENDIDENDRNRIVRWTESHRMSPFLVSEVSLDEFPCSAKTGDRRSLTEEFIPGPLKSKKRTSFGFFRLFHVFVDRD